jgi:type IV pilus assembly protein PilC
MGRGGFIKSAAIEVMAGKNMGGVLKPAELSAFFAQISMVLKAGIKISDGIQVMLEDSSDSGSRRILAAIYEKLEFGAPFFEALKETRVFPAYVVNMAEIGEKTGKLDDVMDSLVDYYEREEGISQSIKSAVTYPMVMIVVMLVVVGVLVINVLPVFNEVFRDLGSEMSGFAQAVMNTGLLAARYSTGIVAALAILAGVFLISRRAGKNKGTSIPMGRATRAKVASGRFASAMSMMISSGLDTDESLDMVYRLTDDAIVRKKIEVCRGRISAGATFSDAVVESGLFSGMYARMITVGFKTGSVDRVMKKLAARYEDEIDAKISAAISILEPTLVAVISIIVGMILMSVMLPLMGVMSSIG